MVSNPSRSRLDSLVKFAKSQGASHAKLIKARDVVVDPRVRLKCLAPLCSGYAQNLMCPPYVLSVDEFEKALGLYRHAILVQVEADVDSADKARGSLNLRLCEELDHSTRSSRWQNKLLRLVGRLETEAFKRGFYLAAGFSGGECCLCKVCVASRRGQSCRHPFEARPSMEAVGIDVVRTCAKAGMPVMLSSNTRVRWTGLVLIE